MDVEDNNLYNLVMSGRYDDAFTLLLSNRDIDEDLLNTVRSLQVRLKRNNDNRIRGIITLEEYGVEENRVVASLLELMRNTSPQIVVLGEVSDKASYEYRMMYNWLSRDNLEGLTASLLSKGFNSSNILGAKEKDLERIESLSVGERRQIFVHARSDRLRKNAHIVITVLGFLLSCYLVAHDFFDIDLLREKLETVDVENKIDEIEEIRFLLFLPEVSSFEAAGVIKGFSTKYIVCNIYILLTVLFYKVPLFSHYNQSKIDVLDADFIKENNSVQTFIRLFFLIVFVGSALLLTGLLLVNGFLYSVEFSEKYLMIDPPDQLFTPFLKWAFLLTIVQFFWCAYYFLIVPISNILLPYVQAKLAVLLAKDVDEV